MSESTTTKTVGRPTAVVNWPEGQFTVEQLQVSTGLSKVTLYLKVKKAIADGILESTGSQSAKQGRPRVLFQKKAAAPATSPVTVSV